MDNDVLRQAPLFSALGDEAASALRGSMGENRLRRGDVLFHEGDSGDKLYIVTEGKVKLGRSSSDGRENLLAIMGPGQMFGELSLFDPGPRSATVTAVTDASFGSLSHDDLLRWLERIAPENAGYEHDDEGPDDMPAHIKAMLTGSALAVPFLGARPLLGTWQAIYLAEHRARSHAREIVLTAIGE